MNKIIVILPDKRKIVIKSGSMIPDPQFLMINSSDKKYKFPWENVYGVIQSKEE